MEFRRVLFRSTLPVSWHDTCLTVLPPARGPPVGAPLRQEAGFPGSDLAGHWSSGSMPTVTTNTAANSALRFLNYNSMMSGSSVSKLASGSRIVKASDDAAGLAIGTRLRADEHTSELQYL